MKPGLVSITFRRLGRDEVVQLAQQAGLAGIEWGGDIHVPHGDLSAAAEARELTRSAGLVSCAYGSYYRCGADGDTPFETVLRTARELGAPSIRVWAGDRASREADVSYRKKVVSDLARICSTALEHGIVVTLEYHANTLTDRNESAQTLIGETAYPNLRLNWQPPNRQPFDYCRAGLAAILPALGNVHVFHWRHDSSGRTRLPLAEGESDWLEYLKLARRSPNNPWALLEFVADDSTDRFMKDALTLRQWLERIRT